MVQKAVYIPIIVSLLVGAGAGYVFQLSAVSTLQTQNSALKAQVDNLGQAALTQKLTRVSVPVTIPLSKGFFNDSEVFYISTEASDKDVAGLLTSKTGFQVVYAPAIANAPGGSLSDIFVFTNGIKGDGPLGFQLNIVDSVPGTKNYSPAWLINLVTWSPAGNPSELRSEQTIRAAEAAGRLTIKASGAVVNCPIVKWPTGQMKVATGPLTENAPYGGAQVLSIDTNAMKVTFISHRGWGPTGSSQFYIITDASDKGTADALGAVFTPKLQSMFQSPAASDLFVFTNGLKGSGPLGFQASPASAIPGDMGYSPYWRINAVTWKDASSAALLVSVADLGANKAKIDIMPAGFIVNCAFIPSLS